VRKAFKSSHASQKPNAHTPQENAAPAATSVVRLTTAPGSFKGARTGTCTHTGVVLFEGELSSECSWTACELKLHSCLAVHHDDHEDSDEETGAEEQPSGDSFPARSLVSKLAGGAEAFSQSTPNMSLSQHLQNNALVSKNLSPRTPPSHPSSTVEGHVIVAPLSDDDQLPPPTRIFRRVHFRAFLSSCKCQYRWTNRSVSPVNRSRHQTRIQRHRHCWRPGPSTE